MLNFSENFYNLQQNVTIVVGTLLVGPSFTLHALNLFFSWS